MINTLILTIFTALNIGITPVSKVAKTQEVIASHEFSLEKRYEVKSVNEVMKKNILLNLAYLSGKVSKKSDINWDEVTKPFSYEFTLKPGEVFAYHDIVRSMYKDRLTVTSTTNFGAGDGYLSDGYLYGDGVCHLASLINWAAVDANLEVVVPKDHRSVASINEIPDDYGVSIYKDPGANIGADNNLYITNNQSQPVSFVFNYDGIELTVSVTKAG